MGREESIDVEENPKVKDENPELEPKEEKRKDPTTGTSEDSNSPGYVKSHGHKDWGLVRLTIHNKSVDAYRLKAKRKYGNKLKDKRKYDKNPEPWAKESDARLLPPPTCRPQTTQPPPPHRVSPHKRRIGESLISLLSDCFDEITDRVTDRMGKGVQK